MDSKEAKFILQSFRPDGADATDPAFAEALALATEDRELGAWLAQERATDAAFAAALNEVEIPDDLREHILAVLAGGETSEEYSEMDAAFVGALASVKPPEGLRDQILTAMKMEQEGVIPIGVAPRRNWKRPLAIAAAVVFGAFAALQVTKGPDRIDGALNAQNVEQFTIQTLGNSMFSLDQKNENPLVLVNWLEERQVPAPKTIPVGLSQSPGIGCKVLELNDKKAALICFKLDDGAVVHMVTLDRADIEGVLPAIAGAKGACKGCKVSGWSSVAWEDDGRAYLLMGKMEPSELADVF
jgi:hypothetical protein